MGSDQAEDSYIDALNLDGSEGGDATFAQNITVPGTATIATIVNTEVQTNTTQLQDSLGWFNVLSYGAIPGDGLSDTAGINSAIRAARDVPAWGNNPTVVIPWGRYNLDGPIIHKASVNIDIAKGALFTFPTGYEGSGILFEDGEININFDIGGGIFFETGAAEYKWSGIKFDKQTSAASYASFGTIHDMTFYYPNRGIDVLIDNGGWINAIAFERNSFIEFKTGIYAPDGGGNSQFRGNIFHANQFQSGDSTNYGIEAIGDEENSFTSNKWWDFDPTTTRMFVINSRQLFSNNMLAGTYDIESPLSEPENDYFPMKIAKGTIVFGDDGVADSIVYLPNSAIVWDVQVRVSTNFNDSGTDLLNVGTSVSGTYFLSSEDVSTGAGTFISVTQNNAPAMMFNNNVITATYNGQNSDSSTGSATIWVRYTER